MCVSAVFHVCCTRAQLKRRRIVTFHAAIAADHVISVAGSVLRARYDVTLKAMGTVQELLASLVAEGVLRRPEMLPRARALLRLLVPIAPRTQVSDLACVCREYRVRCSAPLRSVPGWCGKQMGQFVVSDRDMAGRGV